MTKTYTHHSVPTPALGSLVPRAGTAASGASSTARLTPVPLRRAVLTGAATVLALAAGTAAASGSAPPADPDGELIALCAGLDAMQRQIDGLFPADWRGMTGAELEVADAAAYRIDQEQRRLLDQLCALPPPATLGGCAALARSVALLRPELMRAAPNRNVNPDERLTALLLCALARRTA